MGTSTTAVATKTKSRKLSLDTWAVIVALGLAVIVRAGLLNRVPW